MRALALLVVLQGCFVKPERHPHDSSDAHPSTDGTVSDGVMTADANPRAPNLMFVTSGTFKLNGMYAALAYQNAEFFCNNAAIHATNPIPAHYLPWISYDVLGAADALRMKGARAWVRMDGAPIADTVNDLADGTLLNPPSHDENNEIVNASVQVMTGTKADGTGDATLNANCNGPQNIQIGMATEMNANWTAAGYVSCATTTLRLYCFGYDRDGQLP